MGATSACCHTGNEEAVGVHRASSSMDMASCRNDQPYSAYCSSACQSGQEARDQMQCAMSLATGNDLLSVSPLDCCNSRRGSFRSAQQFTGSELCPNSSCGAVVTGLEESMVWGQQRRDFDEQGSQTASDRSYASSELDEALEILRQGMHKRATGDRAAALKAYATVHDILKIKGKLETPIGAQLMNSIGAAHHDQGAFREALDAYAEALRIRKRIGAYEAPEGALLLMNVGLGKSALGDPQGALEVYAEARRLRKLTGTLVSPGGALLLNSMGAEQGRSGDFEEALITYTEAWGIREDIAETDTIDAASILTNIGVIRSVLNDPDGALRCFAAAQKIRERTDTMNTHEGALLLRSIGDVKNSLGDYNGAFDAYTIAHQACQMDGTLKVHDSCVLTNLGILKQMWGDLDRALLNFAEALQIRRNTGTLETPEGIHLLMYLGTVRGRCGDFEGKISAFQEAICVSRSAGLRTVEVAQLFDEAGLALKLRGNLDEALKHFLEARQLHSSLGTLETVHGAAVLEHLGHLYQVRGELERSVAVLGEARQVRDLTGALATPGGVQLLRDLGEVRRQTGDMKGALQAYAEARRFRCTHDSSEHRHLMLEGLTIVFCHDAWRAESVLLHSPAGLQDRCRHALRTLQPMNTRRVVSNLDFRLVPGLLDPPPLEVQTALHELVDFFVHEISCGKLVDPLTLHEYRMLKERAWQCDDKYV